MTPGRSACGAYVPRLDIRSTVQLAALTTGLAGALSICGCSATGPAHAPATAASAAGTAPASSPAAAAVPVAAPPPAAAIPAAIAPAEVAPATPAVQPVVKPKKPAAAAAPRSKPEVAAAETPVIPQASTSAPAPGLAPAAAPLDLTALKQRLRDTNAIGVFTKLALKNQVDDLLDRFRQYYRGQVKITLPELRQSYELLVQKVLVLLQDSDPSLAKEIAASREAIWGLLADPQKFATL
jgi:hypothetical protein